MLHKVSIFCETIFTTQFSLPVANPSSSGYEGDDDITWLYHNFPVELELQFLNSISSSAENNCVDVDSRTDMFKTLIQSAESNFHRLASSHLLQLKSLL